MTSGLKAGFSHPVQLILDRAGEVITGLILNDRIRRIFRDDHIAHYEASAGSDALPYAAEQPRLEIALKVVDCEGRDHEINGLVRERVLQVLLEEGCALLRKNVRGAAQHFRAGIDPDEASLGVHP
jgi:hypothetical protein